MIQRRKFLLGLFCAPAIVRAGSLMPVKNMPPLNPNWMDTIEFELVDCVLPAQISVSGESWNARFRQICLQLEKYYETI
jgi:hypothetical protein